MASWLWALAALLVFGLAVWLVVFLPVVGLVLAALAVVAFFSLAGLAGTLSEALARRRFRRAH